jgi:hypothetical protein
MPRWCANWLKVTGPNKEVQRFREIAEPLSMARLLPVPEELNYIHYTGPPSGVTVHTNENGHIVVNLAGVDKWEYTRYRTVGKKNISLSGAEQEVLLMKHGTRNWHGWVRKHWGTEWDLRPLGEDKEVTGVETKGGVEYSFETVWVPPTNFFRYLSRTFPALAFHVYFMVFPDFEGEDWLKKGEVVMHEVWKPFDTEEEMESYFANKGRA